MNVSVIHPAAQQELEDVIAYYDDIDGSLRAEFEDCYRHYRKQITGNPLHYNIRRGIVRRVNLTPQFSEYHTISS